MNNTLTFYIKDAHENDTLDRLQAGDYVTITAMVRTIESSVVEVTRLGREDPEVIQGDKTISLVMTKAIKANEA